MMLLALLNFMGRVAEIRLVFLITGFRSSIIPHVGSEAKTSVVDVLREQLLSSEITLPQLPLAVTDWILRPFASITSSWLYVLVLTVWFMFTIYWIPARVCIYINTSLRNILLDSTVWREGWSVDCFCQNTRMIFNFYRKCTISSTVLSVVPCASTSPSLCDRNRKSSMNGF